MGFVRFIQEIFSFDPQSPMIFNSGIFFLLFIFFIIIYALIHKSKLAVSLFVIAFSLLFYYKSNGWYLLILVFTAISNYSFAFLIYRLRNKLSRKIALIAALFLSLSVLVYFKYSNFILLNISLLFNSNFAPLDIFLPIGISFFTFQGLSYILDIYFKRMEPADNILDFTFYLTFFPLLLAGPIMKAHDFIPQIKKGVIITKDGVYSGLWLIMSGLIKKAIIADYIGQYNNLIFAAPYSYSGFEILAAILGYTLQIYCDFSGYSDMAIGIARIMGFDPGVNFNFPYKSRNITDFWQRWHISLTTWFREYLFLPLAYSVSNKMKKMEYLKVKTEIWIYLIASLLTFLLCGLWHGPEWKFILWGGMHGVALVIHRAFKKFLKKRIHDNFFSIFFSWLITFSFVVFLWVFFRATDITQEVLVTKVVNHVEKQLTETKTTNAFDVAWYMIDKALTETDLSFIKPFWDARMIWVILVLTGFAMHAFPQKWTDKSAKLFIKSPFVFKLILFIFLVQIVIQFESADVQPFIYFQF
jgi:D-alanyl-lipoteichoic acid acyltransferase DltB (MBOAT superfamily)